MSMHTWLLLPSLEQGEFFLERVNGLAILVKINVCKFVSCFLFT